MNRQEKEECLTFYRWFCFQYPKYQRLLNHCPNEGRRSVVTGRLLKLMGMQRGWPDYQLCVPSGPYLGLFIEMKLPGHEKRKKPEHQVEMLDLLAQQGYYTAFAHGFDEAKQIVYKYFNFHKISA